MWHVVDNSLINHFADILIQSYPINARWHEGMIADLLMKKTPNNWSDSAIFEIWMIPVICDSLFSTSRHLKSYP